MFKAKQLIQPYPYKIYEWTTYNLYASTDRTATTLFTPDQAEYGTTLLLKIKLSNTSSKKAFKNSRNYSRPKTNIFTTHKSLHY